MQSLERKSVADFIESKKNPIIIILDNIRSMHNVGSAFRTADSFLIEKIFLCGITPSPPHRDIHKTALGATETVNWESVIDIVNCIQSLKKNNYKIFAVEQVHQSIALNYFEFKKNEKIAFVFGNEVQGVSQQVIDICDACIEIPQHGSKHSLNVSVSVGIILWEITKKYL